MMKALLDIQTPAWMQVFKERFSTFKNQWSVLLVMARYSWLKLKNQTSKYFLALIHCILPFDFVSILLKHLWTSARF